MNEIILTANHLTKRFDAMTAVDDVSFHVKRGEVFSLLGPNGAGKTTTLSMLSCLIPPTSGSADIAGHRIPEDGLAARRLIGVVPQEIALYGDLTARQNLTFWGSLYDLRGRELAERVDDALDRVGLADRAGDRVNTFSGGMKRRINIAAGLLHRPELLFLDEPTVGIDPQSRRRILDMILELRDAGMTVLYTTHYMEEAEQLSDRVGIIDQGRLIALGTQAELTRLVGSQETLRLHLADELGAPVPANGDAPEVVTSFSQLTGVHNAARQNGEIVLHVDDAREALPAVLGQAAAAGYRVRSVDLEAPSLETVFLHLTGRGLRD